MTKIPQSLLINGLVKRSPIESCSSGYEAIGEISIKPTSETFLDNCLSQRIRTKSPGDNSTAENDSMLRKVNDSS
jgi:hypothetical protein